MPSKAKAKNAPAHQHDKRHESGLAAPGKRVIRQRSNHNLQANGVVNGGRTATSAVPAQASSTTSTGIDHGFESIRPTDLLRAVSSNTVKEHVGIGEVDRDRTNSDASLEGTNYCNHTGMEDHQQQQQQQQEEPGYYSFSNETSRLQTPGARPRTTLATISTILSYYPLRDAISILILLLSLPATLVLIIQTLFASLTFVPPTAGISLPNIKDLFNTGSNLGYPALATILFVDLIFYLCWLIVWRPVQSMLLDLSQAVIAVSLSGAAASTAGGQTYSIITCSTVVCIVHVLRYKAIHLTALDYLRSVLHKWDIGLDLTSVSFSTTSFLYNSPSQHNWLYTALKTLLGIHIVSQGVTTCIRRSLANANERETHVPSIHRSIDAEANAGFDHYARSNTPGGLPDQGQQLTVDARSRAPSPGPREIRPRESTTKQRRKQAHEVRSKQPLWAAIASTKVTFVKEMEQRDAVDDAKEAAFMDKNPSILPTFTTTTKSSIADKVWISEIHDTEILLCVEVAAATLTRRGSRSEEELIVGAGIDKSKPFYVRINGASWSSVRIYDDTTCDSTKPRFDTEIFGLAPLSSYLCEIVDITHHTSLCSVNFITKSARTAEQTPAVPTPTQHQALRPSSPMTTLKLSIDQAMSLLNETRSKSKKVKRDQKSAFSDLRREINSLRSKSDNSGGLDDRQAKRLQQITQHKNQADEATINLTRQAQEMGELPEEEVAKADQAKQQWQAALDDRTSKARVSDHKRSELERELRELTGELANVESKREKLATRHSQRKEELTAASARQQADLSARQKHILERAAKREEQEKTDAQLRFHIASMTNEAEQLNSKAMDAYQQGQAFTTNWPTPPPGYSSPPTPENKAGHFTNGFSYSSQAFVPPYQQPIVHARGRSSSMLSQYSGFTDNDDEPQVLEPRHQYSWPLQKHVYSSAIVDETHDGSSGSSGTNGSTASSSPKHDPRHFVHAAKIGAIGPPHRKTASPQPITESLPPSSPPSLNVS